MLVIKDKIFEHSHFTIIEKRNDYFVAQKNDEPNEKIAIFIFDLEGERSSKMLIRNFSMFNQDLPNVTKILAYHIPKNDDSENDSENDSESDSENDSKNSNFEFIYKESKIDIYSDTVVLVTKLPKYDNVFNLNNDRLRNREIILTDSIKNTIIFGVAAIMKKLHQRKIFGIHLKNESVYLNENCEPIICDFGIHDQAKEIVQGRHAYIVSDSYFELPPEYPDGNIDYSFDVYSYGMFLYRLLSSRFYFNQSFNAFLREITRGKRPTMKDEIPDCYQDLIQRCWCQDPKERPTFVDIVNELKNEEFILPNTDSDELFEYQKKIDSEKVDSEKAESFKENKISLKLFFEKYIKY